MPKMFSMPPPPTRAFSSMTRGPSGVSLISVCNAPYCTPSARIASSASATTAASSAGPRPLGMKLPVSRYGGSSANLPVTARWCATPAATALSIDT